MSAQFRLCIRLELLTFTNPNPQTSLEILELQIHSIKAFGQTSPLYGIASMITQNNTEGTFIHTLCFMGPKANTNTKQKGKPD